MKNDEENDRTFKNETMVQVSSLGPNKHKRGRLSYLGAIVGTLSELLDITVLWM